MSKSKKILKYIIILTILLTSCKKEYPSNLEMDIFNHLTNSETNMINFFIGPEKRHIFINCVTGKAKNNYEDYNDFLAEVSKNNSRFIANICKFCALQGSNPDFSLIIKNLKSMSIYDKLYLNLNTDELQSYEKQFEFLLEERFLSVFDFIEFSFDQPNRFEEVLLNIDKSIGEKILNERVLNERLALAEKEIKSVKYGFHTVVIENSKDVKLTGFRFAYYFEGKNWEGWVSTGKFIVNEKSQKEYRIPKSINGKIGNIIYFSAFYEGTDGLLYGFYGDEEFISHRENTESSVLDADDLTKAKDFKELYFKNSYKMHPIDNNSNKSYLRFR